MSDRINRYVDCDAATELRTNLVRSFAAFLQNETFMREENEMELWEEFHKMIGFSFRLCYKDDWGEHLQEFGNLTEERKLIESMSKVDEEDY